MYSENERLNLERKIDQRKEYQKVFYDIRAQEINDELVKIEQLRQKNQVRNEQLLQRVQETLQQTYNNEGLQRSRIQLEEAKKTFLRDLNKKDPNWRDKLRARKHDEIRRMEIAKDKVQKELQERQRQLEEEQYMNQKLQQMRNEYDQSTNQIQDIDRRRRELQLQADIGKKQKELETIDRHLEDERRAEQSLIENEYKYQQVDRDIIQQQQQQIQQQQQKLKQQQQENNANSINTDNRKPKPPTGKESSKKVLEKVQNKIEPKQQQFDFGTNNDYADEEEYKNDQSFNQQTQQQQQQQTYDYNNQNDNSYISQNKYNDQDSYSQDPYTQQYAQKTDNLNNSFNKQQSFNKTNTQNRVNTFSPAKSNIQEEQVDEEFDDFLNRKGSEQDVVNDFVDPYQQHNVQQVKVDKKQSKQQQQLPDPYAQQTIKTNKQQVVDKNNMTQSSNKSAAANNKKSDLRKSKEIIHDANGIKYAGGLDFDDEDEVDEDEEEEEEYDEESASASHQSPQQQPNNQNPQLKKSPVPPLNLDPANLNKNKQQIQQQQDDFNEYDDEEDEEGDGAEVDGDKDYDVDEIAIKIAASGKISDTFMALNNEQRVFFFSILADYIEQQLDQGASTAGIYEKERTLKHDEQTKFKIIAKYNETMDEFGSIDIQYELALVCDMILDVFRYKQGQKEILDAQNIIADYKQSIKKGLPYQVKNLCLRIKNNNHQQMVDVLFDLIVKLREKKAIKSLNTSMGFVVESLLSEEQMNQGYMSEMETICKYLVEQMTKKTHNTTGVAGSQQQQKQVDQVQAIHQVSDRESKKQTINQQQQLRAIQVQVDLHDEMRLNIAKELKEKLEKKIQSNQINIQQQPVYVTYALTDENSIDELVLLTEQISYEMFIPKDLDQGTMGGMILFMMLSRQKPNIDQRDLVYLEESTDLNDFKGFIRDSSVKQLFDIMMKHFILCIKKKIVKQKDIELLFTQAVINFQCSDVEFNLIKKYISDSINRALGFDNNYGAGSYGGGSGTSNTLNAANPDFFNQQQQFFMKKSKQGNNSNQNSDKMLANAFSPPSQQQQQKTNLKEFDDPEYYDEF